MVEAVLQNSQHLNHLCNNNNHTIKIINIQMHIYKQIIDLFIVIATNIVC